MNPLQIIGLLQLALSLLANPQVQTNPRYKAQATSFAVMAVDLAEKAVAIQAAPLIDIGAPTSDPVIPAPPPALNCPSSVISVNQIPSGCPTNIQILNPSEQYNGSNPAAASLQTRIKENNDQVYALQATFVEDNCPQILSDLQTATGERFQILTNQSIGCNKLQQQENSLNADSADAQSELNQITTAVQ